MWKCLVGFDCLLLFRGLAIDHQEKAKVRLLDCVLGAPGETTRRTAGGRQPPAPRAEASKDDAVERPSEREVRDEAIRCPGATEKGDTQVDALLGPVTVYQAIKKVRRETWRAVVHLEPRGFPFCEPLFACLTLAFASQGRDERVLGR